MTDGQGSCLEDRFVKRVLAGVLILAIIWAGNIFYYRQYQLAQPLFMKHYYDFIYSDSIGFELYYLVNRGDDLQVASIYFPALDYSVSMYPFWQYDWQSDGYYTMKQVRIEIKADELFKSLNQEQILFEDAVVTFSDRTEHRYNIGQILLQLEPQPRHLSWHTTVGRDNGAYTIFKADETLKVIGLDNYFMKDYHDLINININGQSLSEEPFPVLLEEGDRISAEYALSFEAQEHDERKQNFILFNISLVTESENGEMGRSSFIIGNQPRLKLGELRQMVILQGVL